MAAVESNEESPTVPAFESETHSKGPVDTTYSNLTDGGDLDKARTDGQTKRKGNTRKAGISRGLLNPTLAIDMTVKGSIKAKIDSAYLITAVIQGEELKGVLYHVPPKCNVKQFAKVMAPPAEIQAANGIIRRRYRRRKFLTKDRDAPKKNRTGYNYFFARERLRLKEVFPDMRGERQISQAIADAWNQLPQNQKEPYQELGVKDKERYRKEMREYVYQRLRKLKPLDEGIQADGVITIVEVGSSSLALHTLSARGPEAAGGVPTVESIDIQ